MQPRACLKIICLFLLLQGLSFLPVFAQTGDKYGGVLVIAQPQEALVLDPGLIQDNDSAQVAINIFDTLLRFLPNSDRLEPGLASSWDSFENNKIWVLRLRKGVYFQDGTPFDGQAVKFNLERQGFPVYSPYSSEEKVFSLWGALFNGFPGFIRSVDLLDVFTVKVELREPLNYFPRILALPQFGMLSPSAARKFGNKIYLNPVGTGPFKMAEWRKGQRVVLEAFPRHWEGRPYLDRVIFQSVPKGDGRKRQLLRGQAQLALELRAEDIPELKKQPQLQIKALPNPNLIFLALNFRKAPLKYNLVRQALNYGINKKKLVKEIFAQRAQPAVALLPQEALGYNSSLKGYNYDPYTARQFLIMAGYGRGLKLNLLLPDQDTDAFQDAWKMGRMIAQDLSRIGITLQLVVKDKTEYYKRLRTADYDLALCSWVGIRENCDDQLYVLLGRKGLEKGRAAIYGSPRIEELFETVWQNSYPGYRAQIYREIQSILQQKAALVPLVYNELYYGRVAELLGLKTYAGSLLWLKSAYLKEQ